MIKQRVARPGQGRSGGYRTLIAYRSRTQAVFIVGFDKNDRDNIDDDELKALRDAARQMLSWNGEQVAAMVANGSWQEVECDG